MESIIEKLDTQIVHTVSLDEKAELLDTLPGVAPCTALFLSSALDNVDRFPDSKHVCAYLGLVPSLHQSGDISFTGHITRDGKLSQSFIIYLLGFHDKIRAMKENYVNRSHQKVSSQTLRRN